MTSRLLENYKFPESIDSEMLPNGSCEFAGPKLFEGAAGRRCQPDGLECFSFSNPKVYAACPIRKEALRKPS